MYPMMLRGAMFPGEDPWIFTPLVPRAVNDSMVMIDIAMRHATT